MQKTTADRRMRSIPERYEERRGGDKDEVRRGARLDRFAEHESDLFENTAGTKFEDAEDHLTAHHF